MDNTGSRITGVITLVASLAACGGGGPGSNVSGNNTPAPASTAECFNSEESALMNQVNATRIAAGKAALPFDTRLIQASRQDAAQFAGTGVKNFEFGRKYGYGGTSFVGYVNAGFQTAADFWTQAQQAAGTGVTDPLTKDSPFVPRHIGVGAIDSAGSTRTYALVIGADPGPPVTDGSCNPG